MCMNTAEKQKGSLGVIVQMVLRLVAFFLKMSFSYNNYD